MLAARSCSRAPSSTVEACGCTAEQHLRVPFRIFGCPSCQQFCHIPGCRARRWKSSGAIFGRVSFRIVGGALRVSSSSASSGVFPHFRVLFLEVCGRRLKFLQDLPGDWDLAWTGNGTELEARVADHLYKLSPCLQDSDFVIDKKTVRTYCQSATGSTMVDIHVEIDCAAAAAVGSAVTAAAAARTQEMAPSFVRFE